MVIMLRIQSPTTELNYGSWYQWGNICQELWWEPNLSKSGWGKGQVGLGRDSVCRGGGSWQVWGVFGRIRGPAGLLGVGGSAGGLSIWGQKVQRARNNQIRVGGGRKNAALQLGQVVGFSQLWDCAPNVWRYLVVGITHFQSNLHHLIRLYKLDWAGCFLPYLTSLNICTVWHLDQLNCNYVDLSVIFAHILMHFSCSDYYVYLFSWKHYSPVKSLLY